MKHEIIGSNGNSPEIAILCPRIEVGKVSKYYMKPHLDKLNEDVMVCDLYLDKSKKKTSAGQIKEYLNDLIVNLLDEGITLLIVTHPDYFKVLTKKTKTDATIGDVVPTIVDGLFATYCPNYSRVFYDPDKIKDKISLSLESVVKWRSGDTSSIGDDIIQYADYPKTDEEILDWINKLYHMDCDLTCDIEAFSLKHYNAGIGTITFCWSKTEGISFPVDYEPIVDENNPKVHGRCNPNHVVRNALKIFFETFTNRMIYHNICYDVYVLVYQLYMDHILDQEGLLSGLEVLLRNWDCSQLLTYLATNSCAGNELSLKAQAQAYAGNYAQADIHDITLIPLDPLLKYNLIDGLSTWHVLEKNLPIATADNQMNVYHQIFKPAVIDIIQMQLSGMPINMYKVKRLNVKLKKESEDLFLKMENHPIVDSFMDLLKDEMVISKNSKLKTKQITKADLGATKDTIVEFNPNSSKQLQRLLYSQDFLGLDIIDMTPANQPATGADTLEKLRANTKDKSIIRFLDLLIEFKASAIIISTFLPAFLKAEEGDDGWHYLFGNFRLGGTKSGRLSGNDPNLTNIPSSGTTTVKIRLAKLIKECFEAPPGWLFVGLDFDSLEDKISAVTTKDPNKIKVYSDGYDGHCLRAIAYFPKEMPDIELCPEGAQSYLGMIDGNPIYFHSEEEIDYMGQKLSGKELFALIK